MTLCLRTLSARVRRRFSVNDPQRTDSKIETAVENSWLTDFVCGRTLARYQWDRALHDSQRKGRR
jgi:hypothetical protein